MTVARNANAAFEEFERLMQSHHYRQAYEAWAELQQHVQEGRYVADLNALRRQLDDASRQARENILAELELLKAVRMEEVDLAAFERALQNLRDASAPSDRADYDTYAAIYEDRRNNQQRLQEYNQARTLVDDQWEQAELLSREQRDIAAGTLLPYYTRALEIATQAHDRSPNNTLLQLLVEQAKARRENLNSEEEIMTSGGQYGEFVRVLNYINGLREGEAVMVYNNDGTPQSRMTAQKARVEVVKNAAAFVAQRAPEYADETADHLRANDARGAESALKKYDKFVELERLVPDVFRTADRQRYDDLAQQTREALQRLQQAENIVERARKAAADNPDNPIVAWNMFLQALPIYPGVFRSTIVTDALNYIVRAMLRVIENTAQTIETRLADFDFENSRLAAIALLSDFRPVMAVSTKDLHEEMQREIHVQLDLLKGALRHIEMQQERAENGAQKRQAINEELHNISELSRDQSKEAARRLNTLLRQNDPKMVERDPLYIEVSSSVKTAQNASEELERLRTYLYDNDIEQVRAAQKAARDAVQRVTDAHRQSFTQLTAQLGRHIEELEASAALYASGYDEAIRRYQVLARQIDLGEVLKPRIEQMLNKLEQERDQALDNDRLLRDLEALLSSNGANDSAGVVRRVWDGLEKVEGFTNFEQRSRWLKLLRTSFEWLSIDTAFALNHLDNLLARASGLDSDFAARWGKRLEVYRTCQTARDQQDKNEHEKALGTWRTVEDKVSDEERTYVMGRIRELNNRQERANKDVLITQVSHPDAKGNLIHILAQMTDSANRYRAEALRSAEPLDRVEYLTWAVELDLHNALYRPEVTTQREMLRSTSQFAQSQLTSALREVNTLKLSAVQKLDVEPVLAAARVVMRRSQIGAGIAEALEKVENHLREDADIGLFGDAIGMWIQAFTPAPDDPADIFDGQFEPLRVWFDRRADRIYQSLREKVQAGSSETQAELAPQNLPRYVKLLLLNPDDDLGRTMLRQLAVSGETLRRRFIDRINDLPLGVTHPGDRVLESQIDDLHGQQVFFNLVINISQRFPAPLRQAAGRDADALTEDSRRYSSLLEDVVRLMTQFEQKLKEFYRKLNTFGLDEPFLQQFESIIAGYFDELQESVKAISRELAVLFRHHSDLGARTDELERLWEVHPAMRTAVNSAERLIQHCQTIAQTFTDVRTLAQAERFIEAQTLIDRAPFFDIAVRQILALSPLRENFTVQDPFTGKDIRGWEAVARWVRERRVFLDRIMSWPSPSESQVIGWANIQPVDLYDKDGFELVMNLVDHEDFTAGVSQQVNALLMAGRFEDGRKLLRRATYKDGSLPNVLLSLEEARERSSSFPLADEDSGSTTDLNLALKRAGSILGQQHLERLYKERFQRYNTQFQEAEQLLRLIDEREQTWNRLYSAFSAKIAPVGSLVSQASKGGLLRRSRLSKSQWTELEAAYESVRSHIDEIEQEFPHHPALWNMRNQKVMQTAQQLLKR